MARKKTLLSGTVEEQLAQVDRILDRLQKFHGAAKVKTHVPSIPVVSGGYNADTGVLISAVIPIKGLITKIVLFALLADGVKTTLFEAVIKSGNISKAATFTVKSSLLMDDLNLDVEVGDILIVRALSPADVRDASASALYKTDMLQSDVVETTLGEEIV